jgi:site-specific recombinase XerD
LARTNRGAQSRISFLSLLEGDFHERISFHKRRRGAIHAAAEAARIDKRVSMHTLRHSFATHLLDQKVDIRVIQVLLWQKKLETTALYAQVATDILREVVSPLEAVRPA